MLERPGVAVVGDLEKAGQVAALVLQFEVSAGVQLEDFQFLNNGIFLIGVGPKVRIGDLIFEGLYARFEFVDIKDTSLGHRVSPPQPSIFPVILFS